jgi:hypothetical protein
MGNKKVPVVQMNSFLKLYLASARSMAIQEANTYLKEHEFPNPKNQEGLKDLRDYADSVASIYKRLPEGYLPAIAELRGSIITEILTLQRFVDKLVKAQGNLRLSGSLTMTSIGRK